MSGKVAPGGINEKVSAGEEVIAILKNVKTGEKRIIAEKKPGRLGHTLALIAVFPLAFGIVIFKYLIRRFT
jgi:hypothetical protein